MDRRTNRVLLKGVNRMNATDTLVFDILIAGMFEFLTDYVTR